MNQEQVGKFIARERKKLGMTQEQLAEKLGIHHRTVSRWENGINMPDYSLLFSLCAILQVNVNELLCGEKDKENEDTSKYNDPFKMILNDYLKMKRRYFFITLSLLIVLVIGIIISIVMAVAKQYNLKNGISHFLQVTINDEVKRQYVGKLDGYTIYIEGIELENCYYVTFFGKRVNLKESIDKKLVSIYTWRRFSLNAHYSEDYTILYYENYEILFIDKECLIRPKKIYSPFCITSEEGIGEIS